MDVLNSRTFIMSSRIIQHHNVNNNNVQGSEQKVGFLVVELDRLRCTVAEPSITQIVDIVQRINEARTPEPMGSNSDYSALFVSS